MITSQNIVAVGLNKRWGRLQQPREPVMGSSERRLLASLSNATTLNAFDITPDGSRIVFDRVRNNADIRLIDLPK